MATRNRIRIPEKEAALLWQQLTGKDAISTNDQTLAVIYPGRANGDSGPDFRDAVIASQSRLARGDVEVHVNSSDWYSHGHNANAAYNNVVLHVVVWHDCDSPTRLQSGRQIPVLCLAEALRYQPYLLPSRLPCFRLPDHMDTQTLQRRLNRAGKQRFIQRAAHFQSQMIRSPTTEVSAGQALYRGIMRALGYAKNTRPFEDLADRLPLDSIEARPGLTLKQALLLGTAGLLASQRRRKKPARGSELRKLEQTWRSVDTSVEAMTEDDWTFSHVYPNNSPARRIVAQSYLLERYSEGKLAAGILRLVREAPQPNGKQALEKGLTVAAQGYWRTHLDFGVRSKTEIPTILGNSKAAEIAVNVILPFAYSWGRVFSEPELIRKAMDIYNNYPRLADNEITRHMSKQLCLDNPTGFTACRQQGLIHIFRNYCREGRCNECPLIGEHSAQDDKLTKTSYNMT
jgi:hypothetical protein